MPDVIIGATGIGATLFACVIAIVLVTRFRRAYEQQSDGKTLQYAAYKKLAMAGARLALLVTISSLVVAVAAIVFLSAQAIYPRVFVFVGIVVCIIVAPCLALPHFLFDYLALVYVDNPALAQFQGSDLTTREGITFSLRSILFGQMANDRRYRTLFTASLDSFVLCEATGILFLLDLQRYLWVIPVLAVAFRFIEGLSKNFTLKWMARVEPLEQTQWATLEPRIRQFAEREDVEIGNIYVQSIMRVGSASPLIYGLRHPTLLLSDILLKNTEWRQQDALIAIMLSLIKRRIPLINTLLNLVLTAILWSGFVASSAVIASLDAPVLPATAMKVLVGVYVLFVIFCIVKVMQMRKQSSRLRYAMNLTGDPLAVLVAAHTSGLLTTVSASRYTWQSKPMRSLEQLAHQVRPLVPWANRPVPSLAPLDPGSVTLTISLEQAPPPEVASEYV